MRQIRKSTGLSQEALANECGLHRTYVGSVERGERNISIDNMEVIAEALDCRIQDLLDEAFKKCILTKKNSMSCGQQ